MKTIRLCVQVELSTESDSLMVRVREPKTKYTFQMGNNYFRPTLDYGSPIHTTTFLQLHIAVHIVLEFET